VAAWVDANVLLRFLTKKPLEMAERAKGVLERGERGELTLKVHTLSVAETVWVLESSYGYDKNRIAAELTALLDTDALEADDMQIIVSALQSMASHSVDFADAYLAVLATEREDQVVSFDKDFRKLDARTIEP
jgi:predicted nucleic acid-binding protein